MKTIVQSYRCSVCPYAYHDHGPDSLMGMHRRIMASYEVSTWNEAERLMDDDVPAFSKRTSWAGQECGDRSMTGTSCTGKLLPVTWSDA